ncbi:peroxiredoxin family protein [Pseudomonadota bacterium]
MSYVKYCLLGFLLILSGCQEITDDLKASSDDQRPEVTAGSVGPSVGQQAPDFTVTDSQSISHTLSSELALADGVMLYFTMWCPTCDSHMGHIRSNLVSDFPNVTFLIVDYVTGSVAASRASQLANGYASFTVLADTDLALFDTFGGSMGATVIIDSSGTVVLNEDYKNGSKVRSVLETLP